MPIPSLKKSDTEKKQVDDAPHYQRSWRDLQRAGPRNRGARWLYSLFTGKGKFIKGAAATMKRVSKKRTTRERLLKFWLPLAGIVFLVFVLIGVIAFAWFSRDLPDPERIADRSVAQSTRIYARDGTTLLYEIHGDQKRTVVDLDAIAPDVINATIAIEDKDFYKHKGVSLTGIIRAIWTDVTTGSSQGGSTITQQFVKNAILTNEKKITRKIREWVLSYQIERKFTKQQILKLYFNEIPYGSNAYGIEAASEMYFGKPAKSLSLAESAFIAAIPQRPTYYSPYGNNTDVLVGRAHYVLDLMVEQGYITKEQADAAKAEEVLNNVKPKRESIIAPHFVFYVRDLLAEKYGERTVEQGGLKVITTLDIDKQLAAEQSINDKAASNLKNWNASNASLVSIDPKTGQVLAMVGSKDYFDETIDGNVNVALTPQQPGSSIKPIVYATAFGRGFTPDTMLFDLTTHFKMAGQADYVPHNYDGKEHGPVTMRKALAGSLNIPAVKTLYLAGIDHVIDQAQKMGYTTWEDRSRFGLSLVLGGAEVRLIDHTAAFGAFAADGMLHTTTPILKVQDKGGKVLEEFKDQSTRVLDQNVARQIADVMSDNEARSFIFGSKNYLTLPDRAVAAKTGTTQEYRDAWTVGYTAATGKEPAVVTGVWVGNNDNSKMRGGADGSVVAAPIWNSYMKKAVAGTKPVAFNKPKAVKTDKPVLNGKLEGEAPINIDSVTGKRIPDSCLDTWPKEFIAKKTVKAVHTILYYVDPADPLGAAPKDPTKNPQYASWEAPIQEWAKKNGYVEKAPALESCSLRTGAPSVSITSPADNVTVQDNSLTVTVTAAGAQPITTVTFMLDGQTVQTGASSSATLDLAGIPNGFHTISVTVTDSIQNTGKASLNINVLKDAALSTVYLISPSYNASLVAGSTVTLQAYAHDPSGVASTSFSVVNPDGSSSELGTVAPAADSTATLQWTVPATAGTYKLIFQATTNDSRLLKSDYLVVVVH